MGEHTENLLRDCGDFYLRRADGVFAYQLAVVVDDARMGVTEVVRGADLLSSTARQLYLYRLLDLPAPKFAHCPLLLASDGRRLSKRDGDQSLENLRARYTAEDIVGRLASVSYTHLHEGRSEQPRHRRPDAEDGPASRRDDDGGAPQLLLRHLPLRPQASVSSCRLSSRVRQRMWSQGIRIVLPWGMMNSVSRATPS